MNTRPPNAFSLLSELPTEEAALSPAGRTRREAMLDAVDDALSARARRRSAQRAAARLAHPAALLAVIAAAWLVWPRGSVAPPSAPPTGPATAASPLIASSPATVETRPRNAPVIGYVADDAGVLARASPDFRGPSVELLDDESLLHELDAAGLPAGLIRTPEGARLAFHDTPTPETRP